MMRRVDRQLRVSATAGLGMLAFIGVGLVGVTAEPALAECSSEVDVQVSEDACASRVAVSGTGNATSESRFSCGGHESGCIAVSGTGDARAQSSTSCGGVGTGCYAVSGQGDASTRSNDGWACGGIAGGCNSISGTGDASNRGGGCGGGPSCIAISGAGSASNQMSGCGGIPGNCIAVAGLGPASNTSTNNCGGSGNGCVAISGAGNAENRGGSCSGKSPCLAVSGLSDASNHADQGGCGFTGSAPCVAVSGTGNASNNAGSGCGAGVGCIAVSGTGDAENTGCSSSSVCPTVDLPEGCVVSRVGTGSGEASCTYVAQRSGHILGIADWQVEVWWSGICGDSDPDWVRSSATGANNVGHVAGAWQGSIAAGSCARATTMTAGSLVAIGNPGSWFPEG